MLAAVGPSKVCRFAVTFPVPLINATVGIVAPEVGGQSLAFYDQDECPVVRCFNLPDAAEEIAVALCLCDWNEACGDQKTNHWR